MQSPSSTRSSTTSSRSRRRSGAETGVTAPHVKEAVAAARAARAEFGLGLEGPVHDLLVVVEETARLPVMVLRLGNGVAGAYMRRHGNGFVFLDGSEDVARQR